MQRETGNGPSGNGGNSGDSGRTETGSLSEVLRKLCREQTTGTLILRDRSGQILGEHRIHLRDGLVVDVETSMAPTFPVAQTSHAELIARLEPLFDLAHAEIEVEALSLGEAAQSQGPQRPKHLLEQMGELLNLLRGAEERLRTGLALQAAHAQAKNGLSAEASSALAVGLAWQQSIWASGSRRGPSAVH